MFNAIKKKVSKYTGLLIRIDDIAANMNWNYMDKCEKIFDDLETIVQKMDSGEISLEKSLELFERGMSLIQEGKDRLVQAEERVKTLINESDFKSKAEK